MALENGNSVCLWGPKAKAWNQGYHGGHPEHIRSERSSLCRQTGQQTAGQARETLLLCAGVGGQAVEQRSSFHADGHMQGNGENLLQRAETWAFPVWDGKISVWHIWGSGLSASLGTDRGDATPSKYWTSYHSGGRRLALVHIEHMKKIALTCQGFGAIHAQYIFAHG